MPVARSVTLVVVPRCGRPAVPKGRGGRVHPGRRGVAGTRLTEGLSGLVRQPVRVGRTRAGDAPGTLTSRGSMRPRGRSVRLGSGSIVRLGGLADQASRRRWPFSSCACLLVGARRDVVGATGKRSVEPIMVSQSRRAGRTLLEPRDERLAAGARTRGRSIC